MKHSPAFRRLATGGSPRDAAILAWLSSRDAATDAPKDETTAAVAEADSSADRGAIDNAFDVLDREFTPLIAANR